MPVKSKIEWTDATWNPWHGCKKVSAGCKYCYMFRDKERFHKDPTEVLRSKNNFNDPLKWSFDWQCGGTSKDMEKVTSFPCMKIFTCSWSDFFIEEADGWRDEAWEIIRKTPEFTYQILTKRPHRIRQCLPNDWDSGYKNVWLGVSTEDQAKFWERTPQLVNIPAAFRFLSIEPLISEIKIDFACEMEGIDWAIIGGESGNKSGKYKYRKSDLNWYSSLVDELTDLGIPVFMKQLGTHLSKELALKDRHGRDMSEWPEHLQRREFPIIINENS